ncbi:MAG TPA: PP2C family protein-serine/threonine phosphatase [Candidatus Dormibacteraeota bacterium]|nr:PP2C family protein-serine/threonine phosphatase [Candidatus Dormibacteraeota bacterium]
MEAIKPETGAEARPERPAVAERSAVYRSFWRKLDQALNSVEEEQALTSSLDEMLRILLKEFGQELGFVAGRLYEKAGDRYVLRRWYGDNPPDKLGYTVPITYAAVQQLIERGLIIMRESDPGFDHTIEDPLGVTVFAAMTIGQGNEYLLSFSIEGEFDREKTLYLLSAIQHVIGQKIRQQRFHNIMEEARQIQMSILPKASPTFQGFDVHGRAVAAEALGGDLYDFIPISDRVLGIAVADSSGHGLPAALQVRDAITGLRMGMAEHLKIVSTIERLNKVINRSTLSTRFVSLFYGELERNGNFIYCNAGHPPALLYQDGRFQELDHGGLVLGPDPDARYERGYVLLRPSDVVVIYSDGITEATNPDDEDFGVARLQRIVAENQSLPARGLVDLIFQRVEAFSRRLRPHDDQTVVVVRKPSS